MKGGAPDTKGIKLEKDVYDALAKEGDKTETFSDVVKRLLDYYQKGHPSSSYRK